MSEARRGKIGDGATVAARDEEGFDEETGRGGRRGEEAAGQRWGRAELVGAPGAQAVAWLRQREAARDAPVKPTALPGCRGAGPARCTLAA